MTEIVIVPNLEGYFKGEPPTTLIDIQTPIVIGGLEGGMGSGQPSIGILIQVDPHTMAVAQTSLKLFLHVADMLKAAYGDPRIGPTGPPA